MLSPSVVPLLSLTDLGDRMMCSVITVWSQ